MENDLSHIYIAVGICDFLHTTVWIKTRVVLLALYNIFLANDFPNVGTSDTRENGFYTSHRVKSNMGVRNIMLLPKRVPKMTHARFSIFEEYTRN